MTKNDLISRADAIGAVRKELVCDGTHETHDKVCRFIADVILPALPSAKGGDAEMLNEDFRPKYMQQCPTDGADLIGREDAIRWVKTECNPYGEPTLDFESGKKVIEHLKQMPSADAVEVVRCKDCYHAENDITHMFCVYFGHKVYEDDYCSNAVERRKDGKA